MSFPEADHTPTFALLLAVMGDSELRIAVYGQLFDKFDKEKFEKYFPDWNAPRFAAALKRMEDRREFVERACAAWDDAAAREYTGPACPAGPVLAQIVTHVASL
jgi:hypothetical protein